MIRRLLAVALTACLAAVPLAAHHSYPGFDATPTVFEGRVESLTIANPHTLIDLRAADGQRYRVILMAASGLRRMFAGGAAEMATRVRVNDTLVVSGRLKRGADMTEVCSAQIDDAQGVPLFPPNRSSITLPQNSGAGAASSLR